MGTSTEEQLAFYLLLRQSLKLVEHCIREEMPNAELGSFSDLAVLDCLSRNPTLQINELGRMVALSSGSITTAVDRFERRGWAERRIPDQDRRIVMVALTPAGQKVASRQLAAARHAITRCVDGLTEKEQQRLTCLLAKLNRT